MPHIDEMYALFRRCLPFIVREEATARRLMADPANHILSRRDSEGRLIALCVIHKNAIYLLCVDAAHRSKGIGSELLRESEAIIAAEGYAEVTLGVGDDYLMPGVPTSEMPYEQTLCPARLYPGLNDDACAFFRKRGYTHSWEDCNCFDMRLDLSDFACSEHSIGDEISGVHYRWAEPADLPAVCACTNDAWDEFTQYYADPALYAPGNPQRVLIAELDGTVCGTLIVSVETEGKGLGSVGCTAVRASCRGRRIGANMVTLGTKYLRDIGLTHAYLGYTYSGLDVLYGYAGYAICTYYMMGKRSLKQED